MAKSIKLSWHQLNNLKECIKRDYPLSVSIINFAMKKRLGFTIREHKNFVEHNDNAVKWVETEYVYYLDFYDEKMRTLFLLKYGNILSDTEPQLML